MPVDGKVADVGLLPETDLERRLGVGRGDRLAGSGWRAGDIDALAVDWSAVPADEAQQLAVIANLMTAAGMEPAEARLWLQTVYRVSAASRVEEFHQGQWVPMHGERCTDAYVQSVRLTSAVGGDAGLARTAYLAGLSIEELTRMTADGPVDRNALVVLAGLRR